MVHLLITFVLWQEIKSRMHDIVIFAYFCLGYLNNLATFVNYELRKMILIRISFYCFGAVLSFALNRKNG